LPAPTAVFVLDATARSYVPNEHMKALAPICVAAFLIGAGAFAQLERMALNTGRHARLIVTLAVAFGLLRTIAVTGRPVPRNRNPPEHLNQKLIMVAASAVA
jgi:hypothetical protein